MPRFFFRTSVPFMLPAEGLTLDHLTVSHTGRLALSFAWSDVRYREAGDAMALSPGRLRASAPRLESLVEPGLMLTRDLPSNRTWTQDRPDLRADLEAAWAEHNLPGSYRDLGLQFQANWTRIPHRARVVPIGDSPLVYVAETWNYDVMTRSRASFLAHRTQLIAIGGLDR